MTINGYKALPSKNVSGGPVDRTSNRQIYKKHFTQIPLLERMDRVDKMTQ
jgi:hypothetical protein